MTEHLHASTQQLIREIERKDRRFRLAQSVFMVLLMFGFIAGGYFAVQAYQNEQIARDAANKAVVDAINEKLGDQSKQLQCIVRFFTIDSTEREKSSIRSVDDCFTTDQTSATNPPLTVEGGQSPNFSSGPVVGSNPQSSPGNSGSRPPQAQNPPQTPPEQPEEHPPVRILGVPVCVPFVGICVRE